MFTTKIFNNFNNFALLQKKMLIFRGIFDGVLMVFLPYQLQLVFFEDINYVYLFLWCPLSSLKLLYDFCHLMAA